MAGISGFPLGPPKDSASLGLLVSPSPPVFKTMHLVSSSTPFPPLRDGSLSGPDAVFLANAKDRGVVKCISPRPDALPRVGYDTHGCSSSLSGPKVILARKASSMPIHTAPSVGSAPSVVKAGSNKTSASEEVKSERVAVCGSSPISLQINSGVTVPPSSWVKIAKSNGLCSSLKFYPPQALDGDIVSISTPAEVIQQSQEIWGATLVGYLDSCGSTALRTDPPVAPAMWVGWRFCKFASDQFLLMPGVGRDCWMAFFGQTAEGCWKMRTPVLLGCCFFTRLF